MRGKAIERCVKLAILAEDERTPEHERAAARARIDRIRERYAITEQMVADAVEREREASEPTFIRKQRERREAILRQQRQAAMHQRAVGVHNIVIVMNGNGFTTFGFAGSKGFAQEITSVEWS